MNDLTEQKTSPVYSSEVTSDEQSDELSRLTEKSSPKLNNNPVIRWTLFTVGWLSVVLGVIGIFLPLLPTTPFLLLATACFMRSSTRFYQWLINHRYLGRYVVYYMNGRGIPLRAKIYTLTLMWITLATTAFLFVPLLLVRIILLVIGTSVTIYIVRLPTLKLHKTH